MATKQGFNFITILAGFGLCVPAYAYYCVKTPEGNCNGRFSSKSACDSALRAEVRQIDSKGWEIDGSDYRCVSRGGNSGSSSSSSSQSQPNPQAEAERQRQLQLEKAREEAKRKKFESEKQQALSELKGLDESDELRLKLPEQRSTSLEKLKCAASTLKHAEEASRIGQHDLAKHYSDRAGSYREGDKNTNCETGTVDIPMPTSVETGSGKARGYTETVNTIADLIAAEERKQSEIAAESKKISESKKLIEKSSRKLFSLKRLPPEKQKAKSAEINSLLEQAKKELAEAKRRKSKALAELADIRNQKKMLSQSGENREGQEQDNDDLKLKLDL